MTLDATPRRCVRLASRRNVRGFSILAVFLALFVGTTAPVSGATRLDHSGSPHAHESGHVGSCVASRSFVSGQFTFSYPACWTMRENVEGSMFSTVLVALSNQTMHNACHTMRSGSGVETNCGFPITTLRLGGVLVEMIEGGMPGWEFAREPGRHLVLGHHDARESVTRNLLGTLHANEEITVFIRSTIPDDYYEVVAFLRGPRMAADQSLLERILQSVRFDGFKE